MLYYLEKDKVFKIEHGLNVNNIENIVKKKNSLVQRKNGT